MQFSNTPLDTVLEPHFVTPSHSDSTSSSYQSSLRPQRPPFILVVQPIIPQTPNMIGRGHKVPPPAVNPWTPSRYGPLNIHVDLHDMPDHYLKILPKYDGEKDI